MPRVIIIKNISEYCKGHGIPVDQWKGVIEREQSRLKMLSSMIEASKMNKDDLDYFITDIAQEVRHIITNDLLTPPIIELQSKVLIESMIARLVKHKLIDMETRLKLSDKLDKLYGI